MTCNDHQGIKHLQKKRKKILLFYITYQFRNRRFISFSKNVKKIKFNLGVKVQEIYTDEDKDELHQRELRHTGHSELPCNHAQQRKDLNCKLIRECNLGR